MVPHWFGSTGDEPAEDLSIFDRPGERMKGAHATLDVMRQSGLRLRRFRRGVSSGSISGGGMNHGTPWRTWMRQPCCRWRAWW